MTLFSRPFFLFPKICKIEKNCPFSRLKKELWYHLFVGILRGGESIWAFYTTFNHNIYYFTLSTMFNNLSSMYHLLLHSIYHEHIIIRNSTSKTSHKIHNTPVFTWKPKWEKTMKCFLIYIKNSFIGSTNIPILQLQLEGGYNPLFTGSNLKESTTPWIL